MGKCYRCGGTTRYYGGALGYEAMRCMKCGHDYAETSPQEYAKNKKMYLLSKKLKKPSIDPVNVLKQKLKKLGINERDLLD